MQKPTHIQVNILGQSLDQKTQDKVLQVVAAVSDRLPQAPNGVINVKLVDDAEITALNKQYTGNAYATDVLSFSYIEGGSQPIGNVLGDVAISIETASRQAEKAGTDLRTELTLLTLHGILHILGHDHNTEATRRQLDELQSGIMDQVGLDYRNFEWSNDS